MDRLDGLLRAHQGRDAFVLRCEMSAPWAVRIADRSRLAVVIMIEGALTLRYADDPVEAAVRLCAGDVAIVRGDRDYLLSDDVSTEPSAVIEPGQNCRSLLGPDADSDPRWAAQVMRTHGRSWGNASGGERSADPTAGSAADGAVDRTAFLTGVYELRGQLSGRLLDALPELALLTAPACDPALVTLLGSELARDQPGQEAILDRLVDLVLVSAVRAWFARPEVAPPIWWTAQQDGLVGPVLTLMHDQPARAWTLAELAGQVGWSRASVARRFTELVGESPMAYLTRWRLELAADLLNAGTDSVESVARQVGYENPFAFSTAFKRVHEVSPREYRRVAQAR